MSKIERGFVELGAATVAEATWTRWRANLAARLTSQGDALSSTIAEDGMRRVMLEAVTVEELAKASRGHQAVHREARCSTR